MNRIKNEETLKGKINTTNYKFDDNENVDEETEVGGGGSSAVGKAFTLNGITATFVGWDS